MFTELVLATLIASTEWCQFDLWVRPRQEVPVVEVTVTCPTEWEASVSDEEYVVLHMTHRTFVIKLPNKTWIGHLRYSSDKHYAYTDDGKSLEVAIALTEEL